MAASGVDKNWVIWKHSKKNLWSENFKEYYLCIEEYSTSTKKRRIIKLAKTLWLFVSKPFLV